MKRTPLNPKRLTPRRKGAPSPRIKPKRVVDPEHLKRVRALPCIVCQAVPVEAHHIRDGVGMGQKAGDHEAKAFRDHCHGSGIPRGLLCNNCNAAEGHIESTGLSPKEFGERLAAYLDNPPAQCMEVTRE